MRRLCALWWGERGAQSALGERKEGRRERRRDEKTTGASETIHHTSQPPLLWGKKKLAPVNTHPPPRFPRRCARRTDGGGRLATLSSFFVFVFLGFVFWWFRHSPLSTTHPVERPRHVLFFDHPGPALQPPPSPPPATPATLTPGARRQLARTRPRRKGREGGGIEGTGDRCVSEVEGLRGEAGGRRSQKKGWSTKRGKRGCRAYPVSFRHSLISLPLPLQATANEL